jgi:hypothetical protein
MSQEAHRRRPSTLRQAVPKSPSEDLHARAQIDQEPGDDPARDFSAGKIDRREDRARLLAATQRWHPPHRSTEPLTRRPHETCAGAIGGLHRCRRGPRRPLHFLQRSSRPHHRTTRKNARLRDAREPRHGRLRSASEHTQSRRRRLCPWILPCARNAFASRLHPCHFLAQAIPGPRILRLIRAA